jgi:hypothetical protein
VRYMIIYFAHAVTSFILGNKPCNKPFLWIDLLQVKNFDN